MKTFQVPVWFNVQAETQEGAWQLIANMIYEQEKNDQLPEYTVEEPVEIEEE